MSWFDATGLANIAKSALKGAQKTIDKALDIRDDDDLRENEDPKEKKTQDTETDFFSSWGLSEKKKSKDHNVTNSKSTRNDETQAQSMQTSTWGSFSGSFFQLDNSRNENKKAILISTQPQKFELSLQNEGDGLAPLASPELELTPVEPVVTSERDRGDFQVEKNFDNKEGKISPKIDITETPDPKSREGNHDYQNIGVANVTSKTTDEDSNSTEDDKFTFQTKTRRNFNRSSSVANRLSVVSTDSEGKKSCESIEVLRSGSCSTSPDTDIPSVSGSSSMGIPVGSSCADSIEVVNTFLSGSSIEVIDGYCSGRSELSSDVNSPSEDLSVNQYSKELIMISSPKNRLTDASQESVEAIPDLNDFDDELSVADSYISASGSTLVAALEQSLQYSYRTTGSFTDVSTVSSKCRSGESTPDVLGKVPVKQKSSSDLLPDSVHELHSHDTSNSEQAQSEDMRKVRRYLEQSDIYSIDTRQYSNKSEEGSPSRKKTTKDKVHAIQDGHRSQISDFGVEVAKSQCRGKTDEESVFNPNSDRSDSMSLDEICGSISSHSDSKTVIANDSSREGTLMESSAEDVSALKLSDEVQECSEGLEREDQKVQQARLPNNSSYVKNLLAEAMGEDSMTRETSPTLSDKSRSDLVKVGSEQTSEHTSGDELETTMSSDIEIISRCSPNGDSSSTTSRHSPAKLLHNNSKGKLSLVAVDILGKVTQPRVKGHQRESSEASSFCSEDNSAEMEKLSKKITELTEVLADRESKLLELNKSSAEMREKNQELRQKLEQLKSESETQRPSGVSEMEKDELIKQLREEGDKLSKKELKQTNLIKTLRIQEKQQQTTIEKNKAEIQQLTQELEKVKVKLTAKEELERVQVETVTQLTNKINRQDKEISNLLDEMEKAVVKAEQLKMALDKADLELETYREKLGNLESELREARSTAEAKEKKLDFLDSNQLKIEMELEYLRQQLKKSEELHSERETCTREEKSNLMRRLQEAERRNEELTQSVSHATKPLLRQMEALQATIAHERETWEKQERNLVQKLDETEVAMSSAQYHEKIYKQEAVELRLKVTNLESLLQGTSKDSATTKEQIKMLEMQLEAMKKAHEDEKKIAQLAREKAASEVNELRAEMAALERQLASERNAAEVDRRKMAVLQEQLKERETHHGNRGDSNSPRSSPTLSFGRMSLSESITSNWPQFPEDALDAFSAPGRCSNVYDNLRMGNATSLVEGLQSQLKMREGEVGQLQWELQRRDTERAALTNELSSLTTKVEELENEVRGSEEKDRRLKELQTNYDALLEMYGEKVEEVEELRLDLADVKDMYKTQIDQLLKRENQNLPPS